MVLGRLQSNAHTPGNSILPLHVWDLWRASYQGHQHIQAHFALCMISDPIGLSDHRSSSALLFQASIATDCAAILLPVMAT
jgi:hypothetical protein